MNEKLEDLMYRAGLTAQGCWDSMDQYDREAIMDFAKLVAAAEREKVAEENAELLQALQNLHQRCHWSDAPEEMDAAKAAIEKAIRARGEQEQPK